MNFLLDNDGVVVEKYTYDVFGRPKIMGAGGEERASCHYNNRFLFQGREYMGELGVYDYRNRFYHPELGRFLQVDPTGFDAGDMNLFRYCGDDPIDGSDPTGLVGMFPRLTSDQGGEWITGANGLNTLDNMSHRPQAGMDGGGGGGGTAGRPQNVNDITIHQLRKQVLAKEDQTTSIIPTNEGLKVTDPAIEVKTPRSGSGTSFGYRDARETVTIRSDALRIIHAHTREGEEAAMPSKNHDYGAVQQSGKPMHFTSRYLARHGADPNGKGGNYIILHPTGPRSFDKPRFEYRFDPRLTLPPLP